MTSQSTFSNLHKWDEHRNKHDDVNADKINPESEKKGLFIQTNSLDVILELFETDLRKYMMKLIQAKNMAIQPARQCIKHGTSLPVVMKTNVAPRRIHAMRLKTFKK